MAHPVEGNLTECLYDTLGVERTVDPDKLKIAYRKMAMKWHPDKIQQSGAGTGPDAYQKATERFQQINRAYEVLSDPVERTWYDSHRERILSASASSANAAPGEFDLNLWPFFSPSAFSGFGETGNGFYYVYREIFKKVNMQEKVFGRMYGNGDVGDAPELGAPDTPYQNVYSFYRYWQGFSSVKDFGWCDKYDVLQAPNRKVRRLMEDENNKVRKREKREFNNTVRQLATFVKKRDKRVIEKQLELQREQKQKEIERKARQLALEKDKQEQIRLYKEQAWTVPSEVEEWDSEEETDDDDTVKFDKTAEDAECMICGKRFKSIKQLLNHERSKKHLENLAALKGAFRDDDEQVERLGRQLGIDISIQKKSKRKKAGVECAENPETVNSSSEDEKVPVAEVEVGVQPLRMPAPIPDNDCDPAAVNNMYNQSDEESVDQQENAILERKLRSNELPISESDDEDDESMLASMLKFQQTRQMHDSAPETNVEDAETESVASGSGDGDEEDEDSVLAAMSNLQLNKQSAEASAEVRQSDGDDSVEEAGAHEDSVSEEKDLEQDEKSKKGKSRRRAKQDRKQAAVSSRYSASATGLEETATNGDVAAATGGPSSSGASESARGVRELPQAKHSKLANRGKKMKKEKKGAKQDSHTCQTCGEDFDSRTLLFKHITASNHAIPKSK